MSHMATNKVKGNFYCTSHFRLFVLVSFMGYSGLQTTDRTVLHVQSASLYPTEGIDGLKRRGCWSLSAIFNKTIEYFIGIDYGPVVTSQESAE